MRDRFSEIHSFLRIAEAGSLSEAANRLGLSLAATSRRLSQLEERLGVLLVRRNSRYLSLTDEGRAFYERAGQAISEIEDAEQAVMRTATDAAGSLRVVTTISFGRRRLAPLLQRFARLHPEVDVHLETAEQPASIVELGCDLAICFQPPPDSALKMKRLANNPRVMCAAPSYLDRRGRPRTVQDLSQHDHIEVAAHQQSAWPEAEFADLRRRRAFSTNDGELARMWALDGAGIVVKSLWDVAEDLEAGRLEVVLPDLPLPHCPIVALYMPAQGRTAKVRNCLHFLAEQLRPLGDPVRPPDPSHEPRAAGSAGWTSA